MLKEISCELFTEKKIDFHKGLNVILGDNKSTNSIGKSTLLMIIDFVFGGDTYLEKNSGSINNVGDQDFYFVFKFEKNEFNFSRSTKDPKIVKIYNTDKEFIQEIDIKAYRHILNQNYISNGNFLTFRGMVSLYSRIWGKGNCDVHKPLHTFPNESNEIVIQRIIKLFDKYTNIEASSKIIKENKSNKSTLLAANKKNYINKPNKTEFNKNLKRIEEVEKEIDSLQKNSTFYKINIQELTNKTSIKLKKEKDQLLKIKNSLQNKIERINININIKSNIKSRHLSLLSTFFEKPNIEKIEKIEGFHTKISKILKKELKESKKILEADLKMITDKIDSVNNNLIKELDISINTDEANNYIYDKLQKLTIELNDLQTANNFHEKEITIIKNIKEEEETYEKIIGEVLVNISKSINTSIESLIKKIYGNDIKSPKINLEEKTYHYDHINDTGTGKSFANLILFDISILQLTNLPILIHDSILFKNVGDKAMEMIIKEYTHFEKQIFISIDGINKYSGETQKIINKLSVIKLNNNKLLFTKDWR